MTLRTLIAASPSGILKRALIAIAAALLLSISSGALRAQADETLTGTFTVTYGDYGPFGAGPHQTLIRLFDNVGGATKLDLDPALAAPYGGIEALVGQQVQVTVETPPPPPAGGAAAGPASSDTAATVASIQPLPLPPGAAGAAAVNGQVKWANIMCKFPDEPDEPATQSYFADLFSDTAPGLRHFWDQQSYGKVDIVADTYGDGAGWYTMPLNRCDYFASPSACVDPWAYINLKRLADDCTAVADADIDFTQYDGVNLMFNEVLDGYAWGGQQVVFSADFPSGSAVKRMTWEPPWAYLNAAPIAHEIGHGLGLPHSNNYDRDTSPYDNAWDLMSSLWYNCASPCQPRGTISYHLDILGWIDPEYKFTASPTALSTIKLDALDLQTVSPGAYRMAKLPISSTRFYTIEARKQEGDYDILLPGDGVIIHDVVLTEREPAWVVGSWADSVTSDGAIFEPGDPLYLTTQNKYFVKVISATANGYVVTVGPTTTPAAPLTVTPNGPGNLSGPLFTWKPVATADTYRVIVKQGTLVIFDETITSAEAGCAATCTLSPATTPPGPVLPDGKYKFTVTPSNTYIGGKISKSRTFTVDTIAPAAPSPSRPLPASIVRAIPTLKAGKVSTGYRYQFAVSPNLDCSAPSVVSDELKSPSFKPASLPLETHYWCVRARDQAGNWSGYGPVSSFSLLPPIPAAPGLLAPVSKAKVTGAAAFFNWKTVGSAANYELAFATDSKFLNPVAGGSIQPDTGRALASPLPPGTYYWRVRAINVDGEPGKWSAARIVVIIP